MNPQYDNALLGILQNEGKIEKFLDVVFGFLMRRTDFYHIMTPENKKLGFPEGVSIRMVVQTFEKYKNIFQCYEAKRREACNSSVEKKSSVVPSDCIQPGVSGDASIKTSESESKIKERKPIHDPPSPAEKDDDQPLVYQADSDCYNGAERNNYSWSQTIKDVDLKIKVPPSVKSARDLNVIVDRKRIRVYVKKDLEETLFFDRSLSWDILKDESMWTLQPKEGQLQICLDKVQERWWEAAFEGEDKINTRKIDCSRPMHELDEEAQAKIQQLMYDEQRKRQGLPTSEEQKVQDILAKAWNQEGSPFKGTPFDPSKINIASSSPGPH
ncbi:unnamed protein product [Calicophoron daubneyi]|uniref:CS domain-containing protein n=1 Tax=Calicophoron daubneyi TaxID=300641 RepID=A0AAV2TUU2_CALDB